MVQPLPVDALIPGILRLLRSTANLVLAAPAGSGKTTRVPPALLDLAAGEVVVLEPRRIAARMAARRVSQELGATLGETVGYQVRFEDVSSARTRLRFVTEGVFSRRLIANPTLTGVSTVVLDEFHERHVDGDLALALLNRLQQRQRPDLRIVVMSATIAADPIARFLGECPIIHSEGRLFELSVSYTPYSANPLETQVGDAFARICSERTRGDVLVFLPGAAEIRRAQRACEPIARANGVVVLPLHGDLSPAEQDRAVAPSSERKLILSTNVAESSITIDGVTVVIDSGLARLASDSPWTGLPTLEIGRISKASAAQRAGRAARTAPGRVIRLYTQEDFQRRPEFDTPEIERRELAQFCLDLQALGIADPRELRWLDPPPEAAIDAAEALLDRLRARGETARLMAALPLHPRLAKLVLEASDRGNASEGYRAAALLSSGVRYANPNMLAELEADLNGRTRQHYEQIRRLARAHLTPSSAAPSEHALAFALLAAFPDRVGRRRKDQVLLTNRRSAILNDANATTEFLVALDIEDRKEAALPIIRSYCPIEPEWLLDLFPDRIEERSTLEWNRAAERVEAVNAWLYDQLIITEDRGGALDPQAAAAMLAERALEAGVERFIDPEILENTLARIAFAAQHASVTEPDLESAFRDVCFGLRSFAQLKEAAAAIIPMLEERAGLHLLDQVAPARLRLPSGRTARIHYERGKPPWVESRLQDFFGMTETPSVGNGRVPLVLHLLAPNQRPVQMTSDLASFWERLYPEIRRQLSRRYPKHSWPEKPV